MRFHTRKTTFRQLEIFKTVAEIGSVTHAAEHLHLTQPSVSSQLTKLEEALDVALFEQIGRKLHLTDAGKRVLRESRILFDSLDRLESELAELHGLTKGILRLSAVTTAKYLVPGLLGPFCQAHQGVELDFQIANREQVIKRLEDNLDDFCVFSHPPDHLDLVKIPLAENKLVVIARASHPAVDLGSVDWSALEYEPFLTREAGSGTRIAIESHFARQGWTLRPKMTIASNEAIKESVAAGLGISIVSRHTLLHTAMGNLAEIKVRGMPITNTWYLVHWRTKVLSPVAKAFIEHVRSHRAAEV